MKISLLGDTKSRNRLYRAEGLRHSNAWRNKKAFFTFKSVFDRSAAAILLISFIPLFLFISIAIKMDNPGPVFFRQVRNGKDFSTFKMWKFRSMKVEPEGGVTFVQAIKGDTRFTRVGAVLRKTSLDELPQLINVLCGDMSLIGPRPHPVPLDQEFRNKITSFDLRYKVKPGITGLAQIRGFRGETDTFGKMHDRVLADIEYVETQNFGLDLKILFLTPIKGFLNANAY